MPKTDKIECPICGPMDVKRSFEAIDRLHGTEGKYTYVQCTLCELIFLATPVSKEDILAFYPTSYIAHTTERIEAVNTDKPPKKPNSLKRLNQAGIQYMVRLQQWLKGTKMW